MLLSSIKTKLNVFWNRINEVGGEWIVDEKRKRKKNLVERILYPSSHV